MKNTTYHFVAGCLIFLGLFYSCSSSKPSSMGNMVATMQVDEPIEGVCDNNKVIAILPFPGNGQVKAVPQKTEDEITTELNNKVEFLTDKPTYKDKGMVGLIVNCNGEMVRCQIDNKTKSPELDKQIVAVFSSLKTWKPGSIGGENVDTSVLYSFTIAKGKISLN